MILAMACAQVRGGKGTGCMSIKLARVQRLKGERAWRKEVACAERLHR